MDITRRLKMDADLSLARMPEPDATTAWKYTKGKSCKSQKPEESDWPDWYITLAYFDKALDASLGIVHRPWFEHELALHLEGVSRDSGPAWYSLRNIVLAAGCRIELSRSKSLLEASKLAWRFFENALSVYARLLFFRTSVIGVQALTLMVRTISRLRNQCC